IDEAMALGDKVCLMKDGEIVQIDTPQQLILNPGNSFVKDFIGERKSPWQTAIDVIADRTNEHVITKKEFSDQKEELKGTYIIKDNHNMYYGVAINGILWDVQTLENNLPLYKATEIIESSNQHLFPVVKEQKLVGVLDYKHIVQFLKSKTKLENGVIHQ